MWRKIAQVLSSLSKKTELHAVTTHHRLLGMDTLVLCQVHQLTTSLSGPSNTWRLLRMKDQHAVCQDPETMNHANK